MDNLCNISVINELFSRHGFSFSKNLGQNFLVNPAICPKIAKEGIPDESYGVLEIGPGIGVLTNELAKRAKKVTAIEIDKRLLGILDETLAEYDNVNIINDDILKLDVNKLITEEFSGMPVCVCANLPYYITSPIIMSLLERRLPITSITVMVQKEAAVRLCAKMGSRECGAVSFAVNYFSTPKLLFNVSKGSFMPAPKVDSAVIRLDVKDKLPLKEENERFLFNIVKAAFSQRRKTLANPVSQALNIPKADVIDALEKIGAPSTARAEQLSFEQFISLSDKLNNKK